MRESTTTLENVLHKIAKVNQFTDYDVKMSPISSDGANYTWQLFLATISNSSKSVKLFAKVIVLGEKIRSQGLKDILEIESYVYTTLSKMYHQLEEKHKVPKEHRLEFPKFYGQNLTRGQEVLVLEDLTAQGYKVYDRFKSINWSYAFKSVEELAKLHALSFAFEHEHPEEFKKALEILKFDMAMEGNMEAMMSSALVKAFSVIEEKNIHKVKDFFTKSKLTNFIKYMEPSRRGVLVHGDFRMSNQMYRIDEDGLYDVMILDYQTMHNASPVADLVYFIFSGTDEEFRAKYYFALLVHYYAQLCLAMRRLGLKPSEVYSREDFNYELEQKLSLGLIMAVVTLPLMMVEVEDAPKMNKDADFITMHTAKTGKLYPIRLNGVINDYVRWGVL